MTMPVTNGTFIEQVTGNITLAKPIVGMAEDPATGGSWFVASDGGIFAYHAAFFGSMGGKALSAPIVAMAAARTAAMGFNRIADRHIDARNPRTSGRHLS